LTQRWIVINYLLRGDSSNFIKQLRHRILKDTCLEQLLKTRLTDHS
jgi:hypothetical protein